MSFDALVCGVRDRRIIGPNLEGAISINAPLDYLAGLEDDDTCRVKSAAFA